MTSEACVISPESKSFIEEAIEHVWNSVSNEELQLLLINDKAWETLVAVADFSRDEAEAVREGLNKLNTEQLNREKFLNEFPHVKCKVQECIGKLNALADHVDKVHRDCTISNVVAASTGATSGILTILGLVLAPVTAGVSLALSATGVGLGAAAAVTGVSTSIVEDISMSSAQDEASHLIPTDINKWEMVAGNLSRSTRSVISLSENCIKALKKIGEDIHDIKVARATRHSAQARSLSTGRRILAESGKQVQKSFGGTALAMTKRARVMGVATAGVFLLLDVVDIVKESVHLHNGAKAHLAEELRQQAQELERKLEKLTQIHKRLQQGLTL